MTKTEAIAWAGGTQEQLASKLGMTQGSVSLWKSVPALRQLQIEALSQGQLKADPECDKFRVPAAKAA